MAWPMLLQPRMPAVFCGLLDLATFVNNPFRLWCVAAVRRASQGNQEGPSRRRLQPPPRAAAGRAAGHRQDNLCSVSRQWMQWAQLVLRANTDLQQSLRCQYGCANVPTFLLATRHIECAGWWHSRRQCRLVSPLPPS